MNQRDKLETIKKGLKKDVHNSDTIVVSKKHKVHKIICDLDGNKKNEIVEIVENIRNKKTGLRIIFGDGKEIKYFGMGNDVLNQRFDQFDWVGIFEKASKNEIYWNNVDEEGEILSDDEIKDCFGFECCIAKLFSDISIKFF